MGFFRLVDMLRDGGLRKTWAFLRGDRLPGRDDRIDADEPPDREETEVLSGGRR